jgi:hypothetical protein
VKLGGDLIRGSLAHDPVGLAEPLYQLQHQPAAA